MKILLLVFTLITSVHASENSIFSSVNTVYQLQYSTHIIVSEKDTADDYLEDAIEHTSYLVGALAYNKDAVNSYATGAPLSKKGNVKVLSIHKVSEDTSNDKVDVEYSYQGEAVLDQQGMTSYTLYLPEKIEEIDDLDEDAIGNCSLGAYATVPVMLHAYWTPFNKYCKIPHIDVSAKLSPLVMKTTYPDYPRLVKDGVIQVAILVGKMDEEVNHDPYRKMSGDESREEYSEIVRRLKKQGFARTESIPAVGIDTSYEETFEASIGSVKFIVKMVYGNSVYSKGLSKAGNDDFYHRYLRLAKESAFVVYSGHAGFMVDPSGTGFYEDMPLKLDPDRYQIFVMNGCQTNDSLYPFFALKSSSNLEVFINGRETIINPEATTAMLNAMIAWARNGTWTSYPTLVSQMDTVDAMLGVVGEQDNPVAPYSLSK